MGITAKTHGKIDRNIALYFQVSGNLKILCDIPVIFSMIFCCYTHHFPAFFEILLLMGGPGVKNSRNNAKKTEKKHKNTHNFPPKNPLERHTVDDLRQFSG